MLFRLLKGVVGRRVFRMVRRAAWTTAAGALAKRATKGIKELDEPYPEEKPAKWSPLQFD